MTRPLDPIDTVGILRDAAITLVVGCAVYAHLHTELPLAIVAAIAAGIAWTTARRVHHERGDLVVRIATPVLALVLLWRFADANLAGAVAGVWALVAAIDLDRLHERFPRDSSSALQRAIVIRRLTQLGAVGVASGVLVAIARSVEVDLRLLALTLTAAFVVIVAIRIARELASPPDRSSDE